MPQLRVRASADKTARTTARAILEIMPLVMRAVAAELRAGGELPATAHFGLLMRLREQPRTLTELAAHCGVSLPTMSNSVSALAERGWIKRGDPMKDRRSIPLEVTAHGRNALERVGRVAEAHLAEVLAPLDAGSHRRVQAGLTVLKAVFAAAPPTSAARRQRSSRARD